MSLTFKKCFKEIVLLQCFCFKLSDAPIVISIQPFTTYDWFRKGIRIFDVLSELDYLLQLYQSASAGGNILTVTLMNQLKPDQIRGDGWMYFRYVWRIFPAEPSLGFRILGG